MTVHALVLDVGKVCLVQVDVQRLGVVIQRSSDEFGGRLSTIVRLDKLVHAHFLFECGFYAIEVVEFDPCKVLHGYPVIAIVHLVQRFHCRSQTKSITPSMQGQTAEETQVVSVPFGMVGFPFQTDDSFVVLHGRGKG